MHHISIALSIQYHMVLSKFCESIYLWSYKYIYDQNPNIVHIQHNLNKKLYILYSSPLSFLFKS